MFKTGDSQETTPGNSSTSQHTLLDKINNVNTKSPKNKNLASNTADNTSDTYETSPRKSDWHIRTLREFPRWQVIYSMKVAENYR